MIRSQSGSNRSAYLLLEAVLALAVLSVSLAAVLFTFRGSLTAARRAESMSVAALLAGERMAELRALGPHALGTAEGAYEGNYDRYRWKTVIQLVPDQDLFRAEVEVSWDERGTSNAMRLTSLLAGISPGSGGSE